MAKRTRRRMLDPDEKLAYAKGKRAEERERMASAILAAQTTEGFDRYLEISGRFSSYSPLNRLLIAAQYPDAIAVAGKGFWVREYGRRILDSQFKRPIWIWAPVNKQVRKQDAPEQERPRVGLSTPNTVAQVVAAGRSEIKTDDYETRTFFKQVRVWDYEQTYHPEGTEIPELEAEPIVEAIDPAEARELLTEYAKRWGEQA